MRVIPSTGLGDLPASSFSIRSPTRNAPKMYPMIYPPVGPARTLNPPRNSEKTGMPTAPTRTKTAIAIVPCFYPSNPPARNIPKVARLTGTGVNPSGIEISEQMAIMAAKSPQRAMYVVFVNFLFVTMGKS